MSRLVREIGIMEALNHPNIVRLYETFETAYTIYLVMEYIPGVNLDEHLKHMGGSLDEPEARIIFRQMVTAVDYCHRKWVVHRDLKAPNILLTNNNRVHLVDFGLSNRFGHQRLRTICGSMLYYSPEIINGKKYIGPEVDCWCLGICLFRMVAGFEAFSHAKTIGELRKDILSRNYPMPPHFSDGLKRTIQKCLSTDRRKRSSLCNALQDDPWLNAFGQYGDLFSDASNYHASILSTDTITLEARKQEREQQQRQFLRDMEEEKRAGYKVRKTIIHHAYNPAVYYTGNGRREDRSLLEPARAALYQEILSVLDQVSLCSINSVHLFSLKSPMNHLLRKWKRPETNVHLKPNLLDQQSSAASPHLLSSSISSASDVNSTYHQSHDYNKNRRSTGARLMKKSSALNISQLYQRNKEKTYYFTIQSNARAISSATVVSVTSSNIVLSHSDDQNVPTSSYSDEHRDEFELILLVRSACELLGVTYLHETRSQLSCMLTLCNYKDDPPQRQQVSHPPDVTKAIPRKPSLKQLFSSATATASTPSLLKKKKSFSNNSLYSESIADPLDMSCDDLCYDHQSAGPNNNSHWWLRQLQRLALPHSNVLQQQQQPLRHSSSTKSLRSSAQAALDGGLRGKTSFDNFFQSRKQTGDEPIQQNDSNQSVTKDQQTAATDGTALFAVDVYSIPSRQKENTRILALRFTKLSGSTKVFKLATGWLTSVLQSKP
ncbi:hypothetical protein BCR42DRAFT_462189 [Absidia repens]|uniref:Protein kinase domain-containing protein n=1 Tax=Absidia repens TaxID=90262 RepID=A0A1X2I7L1_9FUNG|nr:hypothetical protein BCR42DRAFT_462189 [Absidia repens]